MKYVLLALALCFCVTLTTAAPAPASKAALDSVLVQQQKLQHQLDSLTTVLRTMCTMDERGKQMVAESQEGVNRAINITSRAATFIGVFVALASLILVVAGGLGFWERIKTAHIREEIKRLEDELRQNVVTANTALAKARELSEDAEAVRQALNQAKKNIEEDLAKLTVFTPPPSFSETPSPEVKARLDEISSRLGFLEKLGESTSANDLFKRAADAYFKGDFTTALDFLSRGLEKQPDDPIQWYNKAVLLNTFGRHDEALTADNNAISLKPDYADAFVGKGIALDALGQHDNALAAYDKAIALKPDNANAFINKGILLQKMRRHEEALASFDRALVLTPIDASAWYNRACAHAIEGAKDKSLSDLKRAIELDAKFKQKAKTDEDFKSLWDDTEFKQIVGE